MLRKLENETTEAFLKRAAKYHNQELTVEYAYPSSTTARYYKMSKTGCYYITQKSKHGVNEPRTRFSRTGFLTEKEAEYAKIQWLEVLS